MRPVLVLLLFAVAVPAQTPDSSEADDILARARRTSLAYTSSLPDFLCTEIVRRFQSRPGDKIWSRLDTLTVRLSYFERREDYKLIEVNGKPTVLDYLSSSGSLSTGEFGTMLLHMFHPDTAAQFRFKRWTTVDKRRAAVFEYKVDQRHSAYHITFGPVPEGPNHILAAYWGEVAVEPESGQVLRFTHNAVLPFKFPISESVTTVEYGRAEVAGRQYLLPQRAELTMTAGRLRTRNEVEFTDYRKFQADTSISFDK